MAFRFKSSPKLPASLSKLRLGRVYDVVLDETHKDWALTKTVGAIKYNIYDEDDYKQSSNSLFIAYPLDSTSFTMPLKGEIVVIHSGPRDDEDRNDSQHKTFYSSIISVWNAVNHNHAPEGDSDRVIETDLGEDIDELFINPLYHSAGDHIIDSRFGNSIRFGGYKGSKNIISDDSNNGKPYIIINNGRETNEDTLLPTSEDINKDDSSIYMTSDHIVPLEQVRTKLESSVEKPTLSQYYKGKQIILNSGRLVFNAKDDDIFMTSKESLSISSRDVNIDAEDYIGLDAKKIYLGVGARDADSRFEFEDKKGLAQPVILGNNLEDFLQTVIDHMKQTQNYLKGLTPASLTPKAAKLAISTKFTIQILESYINPGGPSRLKSKKTFTE